MLRDVVWNAGAGGLESGAYAHLHRRHRSLASRPVQVDPVFAIIKADVHRRIATGRDHPIRRRVLSDLVVSTKGGALQGAYAIPPIGQVCRATVWLLDRDGVGKRPDLSGSFLTIVAIANDSGDRRPDRCDGNLPAHAMTVTTTSGALSIRHRQSNHRLTGCESLARRDRRSGVSLPYCTSNAGFNGAMWCFLNFSTRVVRRR